MRTVHAKFGMPHLLGTLAFAASGLAGIFRGNTGGWWSGAFFVACALALLVALIARKLRSQAVGNVPTPHGPSSALASDAGLFIDEIGVRRIIGDKTEAVRWDEITEALIFTTSEGPFAEDVFFALRGQGQNGVLIPQGLATRHDLLRVLQARLPGLDNAEIIRAMGCTDDARFVIWPRRQSPQGQNRSPAC